MPRRSTPQQTLFARRICTRKVHGCKTGKEDTSSCERTFDPSATTTTERISPSWARSHWTPKLWSRLCLQRMPVSAAFRVCHSIALLRVTSALCPAKHLCTKYDISRSSFSLHNFNLQMDLSIASACKQPEKTVVLSPIHSLGNNYCETQSTSLQELFVRCVAFKQKIESKSFAKNLN